MEVLKVRELDYPFDAKTLIRRQRAIKRELLEDGTSRIEKRIAILGGSTTHDVVNMLELFLLDRGIRPCFYQSEYGRFYEDAVFENRELESFNPDVIYIHTTFRNIVNLPQIGDPADTADAVRAQELERFRTVWARLSEKYHCPIIQNNFELPIARIVGNMSATQSWGYVNFVAKLNLSFYEYAQTHKNFYINDINYQAADYGLARWHDPFAWYMYKYAMSIEAIPTLAFNIANIIKSLFGKNKKALVLDLDNTLWGGVVGDDGVDGLQIGHETSGGQVFEAFQQYLKQIKSTGVLLTVISKNDEANAYAGLRHPGMVLKPEDFVLIRANWEPKSQNLLNIAQELSLGADSFVFVDDNPAEREIIRQQVPSAGVPELTKAEQFIGIIDRAGYFEMTSFSADDAKRNDMYRENIARTKLQASFANYDEYLKSLNMEAEIRAFSPVYLDRIAQLTNKSNQFNLTTLRLTRAELEQMSASDEYVTLYGRLSDRFGDNGIVSVIIGRKDHDSLDIILWLMSCRVLKRDMEKAMLDELVLCAKENGCRYLIGHYYPTAKNKMVSDLYGILGFKKLDEDKDGNTSWRLAADRYVPSNHVISVIKEEQQQ